MLYKGIDFFIQCLTNLTPVCVSLSCRRKLESLERSHSDMGITCKLHTERPWLNWDLKPRADSVSHCTTTNVKQVAQSVVRIHVVSSSSIGETIVQTLYLINCIASKYSASKNFSKVEKKSANDYCHYYLLYTWIIIVLLPKCTLTEHFIRNTILMPGRYFPVIDGLDTRFWPNHLQPQQESRLIRPSCISPLFNCPVPVSLFMADRKETGSCLQLL